MEIIESKIEIEETQLIHLFYENNRYLFTLEKRFDIGIFIRGNTIILKGGAKELATAEKIIYECEYVFKRNGALSKEDFLTVVNLFDVQNYATNDNTQKITNSIIYNGYKAKSVRARTLKQEDYFQKVKDNDLVFAVGPAGTGKTYLAVAMALAALRNDEVSRIIITRPAVEAGESLGFLPGDLKDKIEPYLRPIKDAMFSMLKPDTLKVLYEKQVIEITPLAYMRGRTLDDSFIILDEAQNATITQMKMFLTRLGNNSKAIVTGDVTQIDLTDKKQSGLIHATNILKKIKGIGFVFFDKKDVVRHKLVAKIIEAYEKK